MGKRDRRKRKPSKGEILGESEADGAFKLSPTGDLKGVNHTSELAQTKARGWVPTPDAQQALVKGSQG